MCKCLAGNVACCCFNCALSLLISVISGLLVIGIIIALCVYFFAYYQKDDGETLKEGLENTVNEIKKAMNS